MPCELRINTTPSDRARIVLPGLERLHDALPDVCKTALVC